MRNGRSRFRPRYCSASNSIVKHGDLWCIVRRLSAFRALALVQNPAPKKQTYLAMLARSQSHRFQPVASSCFVDIGASARPMLTCTTMHMQTESNMPLMHLSIYSDRQMFETLQLRLSNYVATVAHLLVQRMCSVPSGATAWQSSCTCMRLPARCRRSTLCITCSSWPGCSSGSATTAA